MRKLLGAAAIAGLGMAATTSPVWAAQTFTSSVFYVTERFHDAVGRITIDGRGRVRVEDQWVGHLPGGGPDGMLFDHGGDIIVSNTDVGTLSRIDPGQHRVVTLQVNRTKMSGVADIAIDPTADVVWGISWSSSEIGRFDLDTGAVRTFTLKGPTSLGGIATDAAGRLFVADHGGSIYQVDTQTGAILAQYRIGGGPDGMTVDPSTGHLLADCVNGLCEIDPGSGSVASFSTIRVVKNVSNDGLSADGQGNAYYVSGGTLSEVNLATGKIVTVATTVSGDFDDVAAVAGNGAQGAWGGRSSISLSLIDPRNISTDPRLLASNGLIAILIALLIVFPSNLFNSTLASNYDEIRGWFSALDRRVEHWARTRSGGRWPPTRAQELAIFLVASTLIACFLDPGFGFNLHSVPLFLGLLLAYLLGASFTSRLSAMYVGVRHRVAHTLRVYPAALAVACVCVIISRAAHFEPGYLYGILMGVTLSRDLSLREEGESLTFYYAATLALSLLAWILWIPVKTAAQGPQPSLPAMILDVALPASFIGGVQGALFSLAPMRFQPGLILKKWNARVWFGFLLLSLFLLLHILVHPAPASNPSALITVLILFALFGLASVGLWLYFRLRGEHEPTVVMAREP